MSMYRVMNADGFDRGGVHHNRFSEIEINHNDVSGWVESGAILCNIDKAPDFSELPLDSFYVFCDECGQNTHRNDWSQLKSLQSTRVPSGVCTLCLRGF